MPLNVDTISVEIRADIDQFRGQLRKVEQQASQSSAKISGSLKRIGIAAGAYIGTQLVSNFTRAGIAGLNFASDIQEMTSMSEAVFGEFVGEVRDQLDEFADAAGRSSIELEGFAASIQDTFVPLGFARGEAAKMSVELTKLATDLGSFKNIAEPRVVNALTSALVGNHEAVRSLGVVITETSLKQELFRMGITKSYQDVSNLEKVQARLNLIYAGVPDALGDAIRTSGSYANRLRDLQGAGDKLIVDFFTPLLPHATKFVERMTAAAEATSDFLARIGYLDDAAQVNVQLADALEEIERATTNLNNARIIEKNLIDGTVKALGSQQKAIDENKISIEQFTDDLVEAQQAYLALGGDDKAKRLAISEEVLASKLGDLIDAQDELNTLVNRGARAMELNYNSKVVEARGNVSKLTGEITSLRAEINNLNSDLEVDKIVADVQSILKSTAPPAESSSSGGTNAAKDAERIKDAISDLTDENIRLGLEVRGASREQIKYFDIASKLPELSKEQAIGLEHLINQYFELSDALGNDEFSKALSGISNSNKRLRMEISGASKAQLKYFDVASQLPPLSREQEAALRGVIDQHYKLSEALEKSEQDAQMFKDSMTRINGAIDQLANSVSDSLADMVMSGKFSLDSFGDIFRNFTRELIAEAIRLAIIRPILNSISAALFPGSGIGGYAQGGQIQANRAVLVGENGPEIFQPASTGKIIDNSMSRMIMSQQGESDDRIVDNSISKTIMVPAPVSNDREEMDDSILRLIKSQKESSDREEMANYMPRMIMPPQPSSMGRTIDDSIVRMIASQSQKPQHREPQNQGSSVVVNLTQEITFTTDVKSSVKQEILNEMPKINQSAVEAVTNSINRNGDVKRAIG